MIQLYKNYKLEYELTWDCVILSQQSFHRSLYRIIKSVNRCKLYIFSHVSRRIVTSAFRSWRNQLFPIQIASQLPSLIYMGIFFDAS